MAITDGNFQILFFGWLLGILSSVITPFLVVPVQKWQDKRSFEKIVREDIKLKIAHLKSNNEQITLFFGGELLDSLRTGLANNSKKFPIMHDNLSNDFYYINYTKFLEYFNHNNDLLKFYTSIDRLNNFLNFLDDITDRNSIEYKKMFLAYWNHLQYLIANGEKISI